MPQVGWTASGTMMTKEKAHVERTPRTTSTMDAMQIDERRSEGPRTRSQSAAREKYAPLPKRNSSHASVSLLTQRVKSTSYSQRQQQENQHPVRRTSLLAIEQARYSAAMDIDIETPKTSHVLSKHVLGAYNFGKDNDAGGRLPNRSTMTGRGTAAGTAGTASRRSSLKSSSRAEPVSTLKSSVVGGMRARQVNEDMARGGDEGSGSRIMVYVRLRPMSKKEKESGCRSCVKIDNNRDVYLTEMALETDYLRLKRLRGRHFAFDAAFPDNTSQQDVYNSSTANLVRGVLDGKNASVFCYGATGAGKTHTMLGTVQNPGVMVLALRDLFTMLRQRSCEGEHTVRLSYLEVYNESVRDLLSPGRPLVLREDSKLGIVAAGLTQYEAFTPDEIMVLLHKGNTNRQTEPTRANETSSRSHAILQVAVEYKLRQEFGTTVCVGKLSLIDLAGSERALATDVRTARSVEGANINRSLLALSSCINALVEGKKHIPFRNSKLTQLLKDSLGGACQTAMIANLSPSNGSFGETQNTLHWADRAKQIRTKECEYQSEQLQLPEAQDEQAKLLAQVQKENQNLKLHLSRLEQKFLCGSGYIVGQATPSTPFNPMGAPGAAMITYPGEPLPQIETWGRRTDAKTMSEKKIWELQRTVELLEMEAEKTRRDSALREEKMNASILALTRDHTLQLKHKDEVIRNLSQKAKDSTPLPVPKASNSPAKCLEKLLKQTFDSLNNRTGDGSQPDQDVSAETTEKVRRYVTPQVAVSKGCPLPRSSQRAAAAAAAAAAKSDQKSSPRVTRRMTKCQTPQQSPVKTPSKNPFSKCFSPSTTEEELASRKRTFWDITNSPNSHLGPAATATAAGGKGGGGTHLRQPGFARRRTSPEQER